VLQEVVSETPPKDPTVPETTTPSKPATPTEEPIKKAEPDNVLPANATE
jgi:hypothetical protein